RGDDAAAAGHLQAAAELAAPLVGSGPVRRGARLLRAGALTQLSEIVRLAGDPGRAADLLAASIQLLRSAAGANEDDDVRRALAEAYRSRAWLRLHALEDADGAVRDFETGAELYGTLVAERPGDAQLRRRLTAVLGHGLASAHRRAGQPDDARRAERKAVDHFVALVRRGPADVHGARAFGRELARRSRLLLVRGRLEEAERASARAVEVQETLLARSGGDAPAWLAGLASAYRDQAELQLRLGRGSDALERIESARSTWLEVPGDIVEESPLRLGLAETLVTAGAIRLHLGDRPGARDAVDRATALLDELDLDGPDGEPDPAEIAGRVADLRRRLDAV
ncbi:MAG: hypothetical protein AAFX50_16445, partial [Acidobacteriota bacterium]